MTRISEFIEAMPKVELHIHIEGTIEPDLLFSIAERNSVQLPYDSEDDILMAQRANGRNGDGEAGLISFIECLDVCRSVLRTGRDYEDIAYRCLKKCHGENIVYAEIMFDPQQGLRQGVSLDALLEGLFSGARTAHDEFGIVTQWIMCFQRDQSLDDACAVLDSVKPYRDDIVGVGLDNPEINDFPNKFSPLFARAREQGYRLTSHCDVHQPNSLRHIRDCIEILGVERIDHGLNAIEDDDLVSLLVDKGIALTGCPTRYVFEDETASAGNLDMLIRLMDRGVVITINSDDPEQFGSGWLNRTILEAQRNGNLPTETLIKLMRNGYQSAWMTSQQRSAYLRQFDQACGAFDWHA